MVGASLAYLSCLASEQAKSYKPPHSLAFRCRCLCVTRNTSFIMVVALLVVACMPSEESNPSATAPRSQNPFSYVEIPVSDLDRAIHFYETVLQVSLERAVIDGHEMALFPFDTNAAGITGALAYGESYQPSPTGPRVYFSVDSIERTVALALEQGSRVAYPKTRVGDVWVAEIIDSEGNQIALSSPSD